MIIIIDNKVQLKILMEGWLNNYDIIKKVQMNKTPALNNL